MKAATEALAQLGAIRIREPLPVGVVQCLEVGNIALQCGDMRDKRCDADAPGDQDESARALECGANRLAGGVIFKTAPSRILLMHEYRAASANPSCLRTAMR